MTASAPTFCTSATWVGFLIAYGPVAALGQEALKQERNLSELKLRGERWESVHVGTSRCTSISVDTNRMAEGAGQN